MSRLRTIVTYQPKLSGLAESFSLGLSDESKQVIGLPVGDVQPADSYPPAVGRFLQCSQQGSLLKSVNSNGYHNIEVLDSFVLAPTTPHKVNFSQVVSSFSIKWMTLEEMNVVTWCTPDGGILHRLLELQWYTFSFRGDSFFIKKVLTGIIRCWVIGFW